MNRIWANRLEAGTQKWVDCPRKDAVRVILISDVEKGIITTARFTEITGEPFPEKEPVEE